MKLGLVVDIKWTFISDLLADWQAHYDVHRFSFRPLELPLSEGRVNDWRLSRSLQHFVSRNEVTFFEWAGPLLRTASQLPVKGKIIARLHSYELFEFAPLIQWQAVDRVILVSRAMQQKFNTLFPDYAAKSCVVYHGKSLDEFKPVSRPFNGRIGMLGNVTPIKRVYEMILTLHELNKRGHRLQLHLAGEPREGATDQRYYASLQRAVEKLGLQRQVVFHGQVNDPAAWLREIDIYVSNSYWEGQQNALIEAMATGCYCLSHFWDGAEEILLPEYLCRTDLELQEKIIAYCRMSQEVRETHKRCLRQLAAEKFNLESAKARMREVLEEVYAGGA
jgi:glycosyltransferase involved in cell wall biosynthesis